MNDAFRLSEAEAEALLAEFRHRREVASDNNRIQESNAWADAAQLLHEAQIAAFQRRAKAKRVRRAQALGVTAPL